MPDCAFLPTCKFFNGECSGHLPSIITDTYRRRYCETDNSSCARFVLANKIGRQRIPEELGPHEHARAVKLMQENGVKGAHALFA